MHAHPGLSGPSLPRTASLVVLFLLVGASASWADGAVSGGPAAAPAPRPPAPSVRPIECTDLGRARTWATPTQAGTGLPELVSRFSVRALHQPDTHIAAGRGDYSVSRVTTELRIARNLSSRFQLIGDLALERGEFTFSDPAALVPVGAGDLGGAMTGVRVGLGGAFSLSPSFGVALGASLKALWMDGADIEDALQPTVVAAVRLRVFGTTSVHIGASITQGLEGDTYISPVLALGGGPTDTRSRWHLQARGPGLALSYDVSACLSVGLFAGYERRDIRLAPDDRLPEGVLRERRLPVALELGWKMRRDSVLLLSGGASIWNRLTLLDRDGNVVTYDTTHPAPFVQLEWSLRL